MQSVNEITNTQNWQRNFKTKLVTHVVVDPHHVIFVAGVQVQLIVTFPWGGQ